MRVMSGLPQKSRVFVTGAEGFIGSHLVEKLLSDGRDVDAFVLYNSFSSTGWLSEMDERLPGNLNIHFGDIRDQQTIERALEGCDAIVHLASLITIPYSYIAPLSYFETNVKGTINLLSAARDQRVSRIVHVSTSEVYGSAQIIPIPETHQLVGQSPYSASKIGADQAAYSFYASFDLPVVTARPFNTFGPRQSGRAIIPSVMAQIISGQSEICIGDTSTTRDFNYVLDTVSGIISILDGENGNGEVFNVGSGFELRVSDVIEKIQSIAGVDIPIRVEQNRLRPSNSEVQRLCADNDKIRTFFGWSPHYAGGSGFDKALKETFEWLSTQRDMSEKYSKGLKI